VMAGPNGSGKSTIQIELKPQWIGVFINADEIERALKDFDGELSLAKLGITAKPAVVLRRLERHVKNSTFAEKLGLHVLLGRMTVSKSLTLHVPGPFNSYLASVLADAIRRELLEEGRTFTFETAGLSRLPLLRRHRRSRDQSGPRAAQSHAGRAPGSRRQSQEAIP